jgi:hypothetical protein
LQCVNVAEVNPVSRLISRSRTSQQSRLIGSGTWTAQSGLQLIQAQTLT